jgi:hypothetical protein
MAQELVASLRGKLEGSIPYAKAERLHKDLQFAMQQVATLRAEVDKQR